MAAVASNNPGKMDAMSRALGAAFLNHQVEKLEQTVSESRVQPRSFSKKTGKPWAPVNMNMSGNGRMEELEKRFPISDASIIIVDSSVLIHALPYLNNILHPRRRPGITTKAPTAVIPLEALNTLDLLKKGSSPSAKKAREASRLLEKEVGENPQLRVQGDRDYLTWDAIAFAPEVEKGASAHDPEWMRRALCCAAWEAQATGESRGKAVVAICSPSDGSEVVGSLRHDYRASGSLMAHWSRKAGIDVLEIPADTERLTVPRVKDGGRSSSETERERAPVPRRGGRGRGGEFPSRGAHTSGFKPVKPRFTESVGNSTKPNVTPMILTKPLIMQKGSSPQGKGLVDKPPSILGPSSPGIIRVLARGEKLD